MHSLRYPLGKRKYSLDNARQSQTDNLDNMEFQISNAESAWEQAKLNLERMDALFEDGLISKQNHEDAVNAERNAKSAYDQVLLAKDQAGNESSFKSLETSIEQAEIGANIAQSSIKDAEIGIKQAKASVEQAQLAVEAATNRLKDKVIVATAAGEVIDCQWRGRCNGWTTAICNNRLHRQSENPSECPGAAIASIQTR